MPSFSLNNPGHEAHQHTHGNKWLVGWMERLLKFKNCARSHSGLFPVLFWVRIRLKWVDDGGHSKIS